MSAWLPVIVLAAFGATAVALVGSSLVGFGWLILAFLVVCPVTALILVIYGHKNRDALFAARSSVECVLPGV